MLGEEKGGDTVDQILVERHLKKGLNQHTITRSSRDLLRSCQAVRGGQIIR